MPPVRTAGEHYNFGPNVDNARTNRRLVHLRDLSFQHSRARIEEALKRLLPADITPASFHWAPYTGPGNRPRRGWCFVVFTTRPDRSRAVAAWNRQMIFGRVVRAQQADRGYRHAGAATTPTAPITAASTAPTPAVLTVTSPKLVGSIIPGPTATTLAPPDPTTSTTPVSAAPKRTAPGAVADEDVSVDDKPRIKRRRI